MRAAFDDSAAGYDEDFTNTSIGRLQRNKVWDYLDEIFGATFPHRVLELNCGTGEDAVFFAKHGCEVVATDISDAMLTEAKIKIDKENLAHLIATRKLDLTQLPAGLEQPFDLVFSNFGGLNCISPEQLDELLHNVTKILSPGGRIILVIMPSFCAWETIYYSSKLKFKKAFRRGSSKAQKASLGKNELDVWYHSPQSVKQIAVKHYDIINIQPVGISLPPSYLEKTFLGNERILKKLNYLERKLNRYETLSGMSDHYLIDLKLK